VEVLTSARRSTPWDGAGDSAVAAEFSVAFKIVSTTGCNPEGQLALLEAEVLLS
jgi:hypothetical protein